MICVDKLNTFIKTLAGDRIIFFDDNDNFVLDLKHRIQTYVKDLSSILFAANYNYIFTFR